MALDILFITVVCKAPGGSGQLLQKKKVVPQLLLKLKKRSSLWLHQAFYLLHLSLELHKKYFVSLLMENENLLIIT